MSWLDRAGKVFTNLLNPLGGIAEGIYNASMSAQQFEYQKQLQKKIFEREDAAVQRRVADLEKAGLSKTLAAGSSAGAGAVVSTEAPKSDVLSRVIAAQQMQKTQAEIKYTENLAANEATKNGLIQAQIKKYFQDIAQSEAMTLLYSNQAEAVGVDSSYKKQMIEESKARVAKIWSDIGYTEAQFPLVEQRAELIRSQIALNYGNAVTHEERRALIQAELRKSGVTSDKIEAETQQVEAYLDLLEQQVVGIQLDNEFKELEYFYAESTGQKMGTSSDFLGIGVSVGQFGYLADRLLGAGT